MVGRFMFNGNLIVTLVLTLVLGFAMAAVSYALIESPCRNALRRWEYRRASPGHRGNWWSQKAPVPPLDSSVSDAPEPVIAR
jgi:peptidoglycan/LPS O-acetylase OafA/YrhL